MIKVTVPATSANLGPGFDCIGVALNLYNHFTFAETEGGLSFSGFAPEYQYETNLVYTSMRPVFKKVGWNPKGLHLGLVEDVPVSRGLGSSATCIVAGVFGANALAGYPLSKDELFTLASEIEGHPDNIAPAVYGNLTVSIKAEDIFYSENIRIAKGLSFVALVPDFHLPTAQSRAVLPKSLSYQDAVHNIGRAALLPLAIERGEFSMLRYLTDDRLHQPYRGGLIRDYDQIFATAMENGAYAMYLSGAGPTLMAMIPTENQNFSQNMEAFLKDCTYLWEVKPLLADEDGVKVEEI